MNRAKARTRVIPRRNRARVGFASAYPERRGKAVVHGRQSQWSDLQHTDQHQHGNQNQEESKTAHKFLQRFETLDPRDVLGGIVLLETVTGLWLFGHHSYDSSLTLFLLATMTVILSKIVGFE